MYRKDYILTMIEELAQFLGRLIFLKETRRFEAGLAEIDEFSGRLFERSLAQLRTMSVEEVLRLSREWDDIKRSVALGAILKELGDIARLKGEHQEGSEYYAKALGVLLEAYGTGEEALPLETPEKIEVLIGCVAGDELPREVARLLLRYLERRGFYADAEDLLFEMLHADQPEMLQEGIAFYERLLAREDLDLQNGDLPREEVEEGLRELQRRKG